MRSRLGASAAWAGSEGVKLRPDAWWAFSGAPSAALNIALAHGPGPSLGTVLDEVRIANVPAVVMVAGSALAHVQELVELDWIRIGSVPFMTLGLDSGGSVSPCPSVRRLEPYELSAAHGLVDEVFGLGPDLAAVAIPQSAAGTPDRSVWGFFDDAGALTSCLATVRVEDTVVVWSMATMAARRRCGYGAALLRAALADAAAGGARDSLLYASPAGEALYRAFGYRVLERWQQWSRPHWVLGRS